MLDLRRLSLLRELHARGTVHATAAALGYSPSAVSQQLAVLEREAGTPLMERVGRNVRLTDAGLVLVQHAGLLLAGEEAAQAELAQVRAGRVAGRVRVSSFQSAFLEIVAPALARIAAEHPLVRTEALELEIEVAIPALRLQHLDVAIGDEYDSQPRTVLADLQRQSLLRERMLVVLPAGHPQAGRAAVALADLAREVWAGCPVGTGHREMQERVCRWMGGFEPDIRYTSGDFLVLLELVRTTGACALLPELVLGYGVAAGVQQVRARPAAEHDIGREVFCCTRTHRTPVVSMVTDALLASVPTPFRREQVDSPPR